MGKETRDTREDNKSGGDGEDGLDKASAHAAKTGDQALARLFIEANEKTLQGHSNEFQELFTEEETHYEEVKMEPDPAFLQQIYDSLDRKEIHHKKLLEEDSPTNHILRLLHRIKNFIRIPIHQSHEHTLTPATWIKFRAFYNKWNKETKSYFSNLFSLTDLYLRKPNYSKNFIKFEFLAMLIIVAIGIPSIVFFSKSPWSVNETTRNFITTWSNLIFSSSIISMIAAALPIFCFISLWFVNVNSISNSKYFHLFLFGSFTIALIFALLSLFNTFLFMLVDSNWSITDGIPVPPKSKPQENTGAGGLGDINEMLKGLGAGGQNIGKQIQDQMANVARQFQG